MFRKARVGLYLRFAGPFLRRHSIAFTDVLKRAERILIRPPSGPGELLFCLPALTTLRRTYPHSEVSLLVPESRIELASATGLADRIIAYAEPLMPFTASFRNLKRGLKRVDFDLYLDFNKAEDEDRRLLASLGGAKVRMGNSKGEDFPYLNWEVKPPELSRDEVMRSLSMLSWIEETPEDARNQTGYPVSVSDRLWSDDFLLSHSAVHDERRIILDLSLPRAGRGWSTEALADVLKGLEQLCSPRLFVVPPPETEPKEILFDLSRHVSRQVILVDEPVLRTASLMERCDLILSSKSDLFSIAYALHLPSVLLVPEPKIFFPPASDWVRVFRIGRSGKLPSAEIVGAAAALMEK